MSFTLREAREADLEAFFHHQDDPVTKAMAVHPGRTREAFFEHMRINVLGQPDVPFRTIELGGVAVGNLVAWNDEGKWLLGYLLARDVWGRGIATAAVAQFLPLIEGRPVYAEVAAQNVASRRVLEKNGFREVTAEKPDWLLYRLD